MPTVAEAPTERLTENKVWTDAEFMALREDGQRYEIVSGELQAVGNSGALHGYVCSILLSALGNYVFPKKLGVLLDSSTAFKMKNGNRRSPDISFFAKERLQGMTTLPIDFLEGAPDLAVEVLFPSSTVGEIERKIVEYFHSGARLVWVINPTQHYVLVYLCSHEPDRLLKSGDCLDGGEVMAGFSFPIAELFQPLFF